MKTNLLIVVMIAILFTACTPEVPAQEISTTFPTATSTTEMTMTPELTATLELIATDTPTVMPSSTPFRCVTLLTPVNEAQIPAIGKLTFSWESMPNATFYVLTIILPSGATASFETKQTSREQYMEAFPPGGTYQWKVIALARKKSEICSSDVATFSKPVYYPPRQTDDDEKRK